MRLLGIKAKTNSRDTSLDTKLGYLHGVFHKGNVLRIDEAKKVVCHIDMDAKQIPHVLE
jgi:hypothetical protein